MQKLFRKKGRHSGWTFIRGTDRKGPVTRTAQASDHLAHLAVLALIGHCAHSRSLATSSNDRNWADGDQWETKKVSYCAAIAANPLIIMVPREGLEPPTP